MPQICPTQTFWSGASCVLADLSLGAVAGNN